MFAQAPMRQSDSILASVLAPDQRDEILKRLVLKGLTKTPASALSEYANSQSTPNNFIDLRNLSVPQESSLQSAIPMPQQTTPSDPMAASMPDKMGGLKDFFNATGRGATGTPIDLTERQSGVPRQSEWASRLGATIGREFGNAALESALYGTTGKRDIVGKPEFYNTPESKLKEATDLEPTLRKAAEFGVNPESYTEKDGSVNQTKLYSELAKAAKEGTLRENRLSKQAAFGNVAKLRGEFDDLSKDFYMVRDSLSRIKASAQSPSAAGDIALIFNYMKMLDPRSVVRESEFATAQNAGNIPERIRSQYNAMLSSKGKRLSDNIRKDFVDRSNKLFKEQAEVHKTRVERYGKLAEKYGYDPEDIVTNIDSSPVPLSDSEMSELDILKAERERRKGGAR